MDDLREVIAPDYEAIIDAASAKMRANQTGARGQMITPRDDFSWWVMQETADAVLAAIKQAGFVVVSRGDLERVVGLLRATDALQENGFADDAVNIVRAMIEASNAPT